MRGRKTDHLRICVEDDVEAGDPGFDWVRLRHRAAPEIDLQEVDTRVRFLGKRLGFPLFFEGITGGVPKAARINRDLASVAQEYGLGMGVGSQRAAIEKPKLTGTYQVRDVAPDIFLMANLGAVQLNHGYGLRECKKAVDMIGADALALHLNPLQEAVQPEGDTDFKGIVGRINKVCVRLKTPVIVKEVGCGLDVETARKMKSAALDAGGMGGTSWSLVESRRNGGMMSEVGVAFSDWGTPTAECIIELAKVGKPLIASGGVRSGLDAAKAIALGADVVGVALPLLKAYDRRGVKGVRDYVDVFMAEFKTAMFLTGARRVSELKGRVW